MKKTYFITRRLAFVSKSTVVGHFQEVFSAGLGSFRPNCGVSPDQNSQYTFLYHFLYTGMYIYILEYIRYSCPSIGGVVYPLLFIALAEVTMPRKSTMSILTGLL